jgi:hypothetical protein
MALNNWLKMGKLKMATKHKLETKRAKVNNDADPNARKSKLSISKRSNVRKVNMKASDGLRSRTKGNDTVEIRESQKSVSCFLFIECGTSPHA